MMESETIVQTGRAAMIAQHVKENNLAYLIGLLISHQMGFLDQVFTYGTGICG
jgi:hypothetical protein